MTVSSIWRATPGNRIPRRPAGVRTSTFRPSKFSRNSTISTNFRPMGRWSSTIRSTSLDSWEVSFEKEREQSDPLDPKLGSELGIAFPQAVEDDLLGEAIG